MKSLTKDARGFVDGIVDYLKTDGKKGAATLPKVQTLLSKVSDRAAKEHTARVVSAVPLTNEEKLTLENSLSKLMKHPITLVNDVDEEVLAGIRIEIADFIIDTTYKGRLSQMTAILTKGNRT